MSLKKIDRAYCGNTVSGGYQLLFQLLNDNNLYESWVQGTVWKKTMLLYASLYPPAPTTANYDTNAVTIPSRALYVCDVTWSDNNQCWKGVTPWGDIEIKTFLPGTFLGWYDGVADYAGSGTTVTTKFQDRILAGLLYCADQPMRLSQVASPATGNSINKFTLTAEGHVITKNKALYDSIINYTPPAQNVGTYSLHYISHCPAFDVSLFGVNRNFRGYVITDVVEDYQYDRKTQVTLVKNVTTNILQDAPAVSPGFNRRIETTTPGKFYNRRRYHVIPEEEWFHTSCSPILFSSAGYANQAPIGYEVYEYFGDIEPAGQGPQTLAWGVQGVAGGTTFDSQVNYDWTIPVGPSYETVSISKFVNVRRWKWKNLDVNYPRLKLKITTPDGVSDTAWVGPTPIILAAGAGNSFISGAGQAWPDDDKLPDYPDQGLPGRVPDLAIYSKLDNLTNCCPESGVTAVPISIQANQSNKTLNLVQHPNEFYDFDIEVTDDSKAGGYTFQLDRVQDSEYAHAQDRFIRKNWLTAPPSLWRWPEVLNITVSGLGTIGGLDRSWCNFSGYLYLKQTGPTPQSVWLSNSTLQYGKVFYGIGPNELCLVRVNMNGYKPFFDFIRNGKFDPLSGSDSFTCSVLNSYEFSYLKPTSGQLATLSNTVGVYNPIPGASVQIEPIA